MALYLIAQSGSFASALSILQQICGAVTQLGFAGPTIDALYKERVSLQSVNPHPTKAGMPLTQAITVNRVQYTYRNAPQPALKNLSLTIPAKCTVGLVDATGKTTTVDLIRGLVEAEEGTLEVDGQAITEHNRRTWQRVINYVPHHI